MHYEIRHTVLFEETNLVGNVYYVNLLRWQGQCRERFLADYAPSLLGEMKNGLCLVTLRVSCEFLAELTAFDEVAIRMRLGSQTQNRLDLQFEFWRIAKDPDETLVALGDQQVAFFRRSGDQMMPTPVPQSLEAALARYR